jgi:hypothetical protein
VVLHGVALQRRVDLTLFHRPLKLPVYRTKLRPLIQSRLPCATYVGSQYRNPLRE